MNITIEKLKEKDLKDAINLYDTNRRIRTNYDKLLSIYSDIYNNPAYHNIVAKVDGKVVGLATIIINYDIVDKLKPFLTIWNFGVKEEYRRNKVGTKMFEYIYQFAKNNNCDFISLIAENDNKIAQAFYESLGYKKEIGYVRYVDEK